MLQHCRADSPDAELDVAELANKTKIHLCCLFQVEGRKYPQQMTLPFLCPSKKRKGGHQQGLEQKPILGRKKERVTAGTRSKSSELLSILKEKSRRNVKEELKSSSTPFGLVSFSFPFICITLELKLLMVMAVVIELSLDLAMN